MKCWLAKTGVAFLALVHLLDDEKRHLHRGSNPVNLKFDYTTKDASELQNRNARYGFFSADTDNR